MAKTVDMTTGSPVRHLLKFSFPLILSNLGQQLYMVTDAVIVGRLIGINALASIGACDWIFWLILWSGIGVTHGFAIFVSRYFGRKDYQKLNMVITNGIWLSLIVSAVMTISGWLCVLYVLEWMQTPPELLPGAKMYLGTMLSGTVILIFYNYAGAVLRAFGNTREPFIGIVIAGVLNIILDLVFINCFNWGIFGAAAASLAAQLAALLYCIRQLGTIKYIRLAPEHWKISRLLAARMLNLSLPMGFLYIGITFGGVLLQIAINQQGGAFIAGFAAGNKAYGLLECAAIALGMAAGTFTAQNYGAGNKKRVKYGVNRAVWLSLISAVIVGGIIILCGKNIIQLFMDQQSPDAAKVIRVGYKYLAIMAAFIILVFPLLIYRNVLQGLGRPIWPMISGICESILRAGLGIFGVMYLGAELLYCIEPCTWVFALALCVIPWCFYRRKLLSEPR